MYCPVVTGVDGRGFSRSKAEALGDVPVVDRERFSSDSVSVGGNFLFNFFGGIATEADLIEGRSDGDDDESDGAERDCER